MKKENLFIVLIAISMLFQSVSAQDIEPVDLGNGIKIINRSFKEENKERVFEISADYPEITGLDSAQARAFNTLAKSMVIKEIDRFRQLMMEMDAEELEYARKRGFPNYSEVGYSIDFASLSVISVAFGNGVYSGGAHPNSHSFTLNFDLKNGRKLMLGDLFLKNANYLNVISDYAIAELKTQGEYPDNEWIERGAAPLEENFRSWNITKEGLRINFDQYQVAPYVAGPQEVTIPYEKLRGVLRVFDFEPLQYANSGNPVNMCRNGLFPSDSDNFRIGKITGRRNEKIFFYKDDESICPGDEKCKTKSYIVPGDEIIVARTFGNYACGWYQPAKGYETVGWISLDKIDFLDDSRDLPWIGGWSYGENSIKIAPMKIDGKVKITGNAFWIGLGDNVHIGEIDFSGIPVNNKLELGESGEYECRVKMQRAGKFLIVSDNLNCGGANVSFNGVYRREK